MNKKYLPVLRTFLLVLVMTVPVLLFAQWSPGQPIVNCTDNCDWNKLIELINRVISFLLYLATILAIFAFMYAGFLLMTSGGSESKAKEAKDIFFKVLTGLILAYGAWVLVYFIVSILGVTGQFKNLI